MDASLIERSLEIAAAHGDVTARVYARLFVVHPEMEALFVRDTNGAVKGEMLARVFEMILDFIDRGAYGARMIQCEVITHEGYGVPPEIFSLFFTTLADTLQDLLGPDWDAATDEAWDAMITRMHWFTTHPDQTVGHRLA